MFIDDDELREVFKVTGEEHLQQIEANLLHLEKYPDDSATLENLLREIHSLKGDANMLGIKEVGTLAHQFEDLLGTVKRGDTPFSAELSDRLCHGLDAIRQLVQEAVTGTAAGVNLLSVMAYLMGAPKEQEQAIENGSNGKNAEEPTGAIELETAVDAATINGSNGHRDTLAQNLEAIPYQFSSPAYAPALPQPHLPTYRIDTIRVETAKLDTLMTQAGELTVTKTRINRRLVDIEALLSVWEDWSRDTFNHRTAFRDLERGAGSRQFTQTQSYYQRHQQRLEQVGQMLKQLQQASYEDSSRLESVATDLEEDIRSLCLLPLSSLFQQFSRMVRDLARQQGKAIELVIEGGDTRADKRILEEMKDPLMHLLRNAIDHGIESPAEREHLGKPRTATIALRGYQTATNIVIEVADDGRGLMLDTIKHTALQRGICRAEDLAKMSDRQIQALIFAPGFSTRSLITEVSGRGVGLDVVKTNVDRLKGTIQVESNHNIGSTFQIQLRTTLATAHVLLVVVDGITYAIPVEFVETSLLVQPDEIFTIEGRNAIRLDQQPVSIVKLAHLLELKHFSSTPPQSTPAHSFPCIILKIGEERLGLLIDALLDEQDVVLKPQSKLLQRVRNVFGATILGTGEVCMVLNPQDLIKSVQKSTSVAPAHSAVPTTTIKQVVLLVEDSIAIRTQEKRILESAGYEIVTAVDGLDALSKLPTRTFDAIVSDVQMPNLDGLALTTKVRQHREYSELPIILVTSLASDEDKRRGAEAGANAYIPKGSFDQTVLIETLKRLV
ncbi:hybrid sensor histidine kinase/response regulator [Phormidium sp. CLA17]|uniref:hybrid sensor histidine kinase/response regulator n=1 Tax=Leptolyngbya sp. Cla-17 TaxID=2803751 RepID=UPI0014916767|nr:hybrid sensor histidine kinase/response regulator [Leptolyngbya sp. Cla-17]MBM0744616.1 hybrid sensor histidine kinase/response regulator [Leptolyngbya sp. Cla-17]